MSTPKLVGRIAGCLYATVPHIFAAIRYREVILLPTNDDVSVPAVQYTWTAQPGDVSRFSRLALLRVFRRPKVMVYFAFVGVALVVAVWSGEEELAALFGVIVVGFPLALFVVIVRVNRTTMRPGAQWATGFNSFGMLLEDPLAQIVIGHGSIARIEVAHGLVYLYIHGGMGRAARIPESLCPPEARAYLLSMVDARPRSTSPGGSST
ncbi:hypothetical protein HYG77_30405 [Rhodococcus sp. ZPP]|uniref:hypothetical protein n=1 Tax=Rhodococcus sp. ZPP TaxID=2749906 RepID=UPI001AD862E7|nr:hypothetical protein [Rhodococcus sp. ZPP]QTJ69422.1 hypothetical protein HYG77_30405 [Rhodococcus sp. ZPP]